MIYLNQLRAESLLYARSINQIRKNFYTEFQNEHGDINKTKQFLVLFTQDKSQINAMTSHNFFCCNCPWII